MLSRRPPEPTLVALTLVALTVTVGEPRAAAAPSEAEITQARQRFAEARKLEDAGRWAEALSLLQRVAEVKTTPQVRFHVALAMEHVGLWTQALDGYAQARTEAGSAAPDVVREADEHLARLGQLIPTVSLHVAGATPGDELLLDRRQILIDDRPLPVRANPGAHTAEVRRGGAVLAREYFAVEARDTRRIELRVGSIAPEPPDPGRGSDRWLLPGETAPPSSAGRVPRALGWTAIGLGGASLTAMGVFIGERASALASLTSACPSLTHCPTSVATTVSDGKTDSMVVNVTAVVGSVLAATGVVLLIVAPSGATPPPAATWIGIRPAGLTLGGAFQ